MTIFSTTRDLTAIQRSATPTPPMELLFLCNHKSRREGAHIKRIKGIGEVLWRCAACVKARAAE